MNDTWPAAKMPLLIGCSTGAVVSLTLYAGCGWLMVFDYTNHGGFFPMPPFLGYAATAVGLLLWVIASVCEAGVLMALAPEQRRLPYGVACATLGAIVGIAAIAVIIWGGMAYASGDIDAVWLPVAIAPPLVSTAPLLVLAAIHALVLPPAGGRMP